MILADTSLKLLPRVLHFDKITRYLMIETLKLRPAAVLKRRYYPSHGSGRTAASSSSLERYFGSSGPDGNSIFMKGYCYCRHWAFCPGLDERVHFNLVQRARKIRDTANDAISTHEIRLPPRHPRYVTHYSPS